MGEGGTIPYKAAVPVADLSAGMNAAFAVTAALREREVTGRGQLVSTSLLESTTALLTFLAAKYFAERVPPQSYGNSHPSIVPYDSFATGDGYLSIAVINESLWERFCAMLGLESLTEDARFATNAERVAHKAELYAILVPKLASMSGAALFEALRGAGVPVGKVQDLREVFDSEQVRAMSIERRIQHPVAGEVSQIAAPFHFHGGAADRDPAPPPVLGQDSDRVLRGLGYAEDEIEAMVRAGATSVRRAVRS
jgi:crotonobetainyl-CoA:carnitine CoA-transferase CaiB-like acyl-CoA transferase